MQRGKAAHREPYDMRGPIGDRAHYVSEILGRTHLVIGLQVGWHVGRRIAARAIRCAAIMTREKVDLRIPAAGVARKLVHEQERCAASDGANMKPDTVGGSDHHSGTRSSFSSRKAAADGARGKR